MADVTITVPDNLVQELNEIAVKAGFANARQMLIAYLRFTIKGYRGALAIKGVREVAEEAAAQEAMAIQ